MEVIKIAKKYNTIEIKNRYRHTSTKNIYTLNTTFGEYQNVYWIKKQTFSDDGKSKALDLQKYLLLKERFLTKYISSLSDNVEHELKARRILKNSGASSDPMTFVSIFKLAQNAKEIEPLKNFVRGVNNLKFHPGDLKKFSNKTETDAAHYSDFLDAAERYVESFYLMVAGLNQIAEDGEKNENSIFHFFDQKEGKDVRLLDMKENLLSRILDDLKKRGEEITTASRKVKGLKKQIKNAAQLQLPLQPINANTKIIDPLVKLQEAMAGYAKELGSILEGIGAIALQYGLNFQNSVLEKLLPPKIAEILADTTKFNAAHTGTLNSRPGTIRGDVSFDYIDANGNKAALTTKAGEMLADFKAKFEPLASDKSFISIAVTKDDKTLSTNTRLSINEEAIKSENAVPSYINELGFSAKWYALTAQDSRSRDLIQIGSLSTKRFMPTLLSLGFNGSVIDEKNGNEIRHNYLLSAYKIIASLQYKNNNKTENPLIEILFNEHFNEIALGGTNSIFNADGADLILINGFLTTMAEAVSHSTFIGQYGVGKANKNAPWVGASERVTYQVGGRTINAPYYIAPNRAMSFIQRYHNSSLVFQMRLNQETIKKMDATPLW